MPVRIDGLASSSGGVSASLLLRVCLAFLLVTTVSCSSDDPDQVKSVFRIRVDDNLDPYREYEVFRKTQAALITSPFVVTSALRDASLAKLSILESADDPVQWLEDNVIATLTDGSELMSVTCPAAPDDEAKVILDGIARAYQREVQQSERNDVFVELEFLETSYRENERKMRDMIEKIHSLAVKLGTDNSVAAQLDRELSIDKVKSLQNRVADLEDKLLNARANEMLVEIETDSSDAGLEQIYAASEVRVYEQLLREQEESLEAAIVRIKNEKKFSPEQIVLQYQLEHLKNESLVLLQEIGRLKVKLSTPSRIQLLQMAS